MAVDENVGLAAGLFWHADTVTNEAANEVAEFRGGWTSEIIMNYAEWFGQAITRKGATLIMLDIKFVIAEVAFKPASFALLWGISANASDVLKDAGGSTPATSYTFDSTLSPPEGNWLLECTMDGQIFQAFATDAKVMGTVINFTNEDYVVHNLEMIIYGATGSLCKFMLEN